jgi:hypothetical protein
VIDSDWMIIYKSIAWTTTGFNWASKAFIVNWYENPSDPCVARVVIIKSESSMTIDLRALDYDCF